MSPRPDDEDAVDATADAEVNESSGKGEDAAPGDASQKHAAKRRTKTGCLTCRKRRIKCGEEKPICKNCIKSKRECAGYIQPLVYKQQGHGRSEQHYQAPDHVFARPRDDIPQGAYFDSHARLDDPYSAPHHNPGSSVPLGYAQFHASLAYEALPPGRAFDPHSSHVPGYEAWPMAQQSYTQQAPPGLGIGGQYPGIGLPSGSSFPLASPSIGVSGLPLTSAVHATDRSSEFHSHYPDQHWHSPEFHGAAPSHSQPSAPLPHYTPVPPGYIEEVRRRSSLQPPTSSSGFQGVVPFGPLSAGPPHMVERRDEVLDDDDDIEDPDDPFDVELEDANLSFQEATENLTEILARSGRQNWRPARVRGDRRQQHNTLTRFRPGSSVSPLRDEKNERVFCHFVEITSHCISIFERHHFSPINAPVRTLWNFAVPTMALSNATLAHAILALGALHLAKLHDMGEDPAMKHFSCAVRRVGKLLGLPNRRHEIATLATILVLGFYEVMNGDHSRWTLHLSGAAKLISEHDYAGFIRTARRMRTGAKARINQWTAQFPLTEESYARVAGIPLSLLDDIDWEVDVALVSQLTGLHVDYDRQVQPNFDARPSIIALSDKDVDDYKAKMDLRWWFCKQDIFQSMVSGDPLLMPFAEWVYCPPRGQFGLPDNPYATLDHLLLIMARLGDFGGKDRFRKQRSVAAAGGQWRPPAWLFGPNGPGGPPREGSKPNSTSSSHSSPSTGSGRSSGQGGPKPSPAPSANEGRLRQSKPGAQAPSMPGGPPMFGMIPPSDQPVNTALQNLEASIRDPAFTVRPEKSKALPPRSLEDDTTKAFAEHVAIAKAFDLFAKSLGPDFEPVSPGGLSITTPFGPALVYKNSAIANIWAFYNVGRILLHRLHPDMPPAAMIAAGVTSHLTRDYAQAVGKICAGLYATQHYGPNGALEPVFAGAMMESTFSLLFAGIQYTDAAQRGWTITKLREVSRTCGWRTSVAVAAACELAWDRMGQAGRGPPYHRTLDVNNKDVRISGAWRKSPSEHSPQSSNAEAEHESEFVNHDRSLIDRSASSRVHWALGLLSVEEDIQKMKLEDR